ncbi:Uncharacterised protein [Citrobacter koseri]|nr:Uncharacterised protein [Citrobacter koseri]STT23499.1 Uncharacterised protein [Citrobacter koseri]
MVQGCFSVALQLTSFLSQTGIHGLIFIEQGDSTTGQQNPLRKAIQNVVICNPSAAEYRSFDAILFRLPRL